MFVFQVSAQSFLKDGKIPDDLVITISLTATVQFGGYQKYKITSDGKVSFEEFSNLPRINHDISSFLVMVGQKTPKIPKIKEKLSRKQLKKIITEFEKSAFYEITEEQQCEPSYNHYTTKGISITLNGKTKAIEEVKLVCNDDKNPRLKSFVNLYDLISKELRYVKKTVINNQ